MEKTIDRPHRSGSEHPADTGFPRVSGWAAAGGSRGLDLLFAIATVVLAVYVFRIDTTGLFRFMPDDAFYYLQTAENLNAGRGQTFDGIHPSNGFQPLWLYVLTGFQRLTSWTGIPAERGALLLQLGLLFVSAGLLQRLQLEFFSRKTVWVCAAFFLFLVFLRYLNGMETPILILSLTTLAYFGHRRQIFCTVSPSMGLTGVGSSGVGSSGAGSSDTGSPGTCSPIAAVIFGVLFGLTLLSRLDTIFLFCGAALIATWNAIWFPRDRNRIVGQFFWICLGAGVVVGPYLVSNVVAFGALMPISGKLKSSFPDVQPLSNFTLMVSPSEWVSVAAAAVYLAWYLMFSRHSSARRSYRAGAAALSVGVILHAVHVGLFMDWAVFDWHFATYHLLLPVILAEAVESLLYFLGKSRASRLYGPGLAVLLAVGLHREVGLRTREPEAWLVEAYQAGLWASKETPSDTVLAMKDAGTFGYFSKRNVINLDGVVNTAGYQRVLADGRLAEYLEESDVDFVVQHSLLEYPEIQDGDYETSFLRYPSRLFEPMADTLTIERGREVYRRDYREDFQGSVFLIWSR